MSMSEEQKQEIRELITDIVSDVLSEALGEKTGSTPDFEQGVTKRETQEEFIARVAEDLIKDADNKDEEYLKGYLQAGIEHVKSGRGYVGFHLNLEQLKSNDMSSIRRMLNGIRIEHKDAIYILEDYKEEYTDEGDGSDGEQECEGCGNIVGVSEEMCGMCCNCPSVCMECEHEEEKEEAEVKMTILEGLQKWKNEYPTTVEQYRTSEYLAKLERLERIHIPLLLDHVDSLAGTKHMFDELISMSDEDIIRLWRTKE